MVLDLNSKIIEYTLIVSGDITGDGKVNIADIVKIADYTLSGGILNNYEMKAVDITGDGKVNIADIVKLADYTSNKTIEIW